MDWTILIVPAASLLSAVSVALLNNWDKINPNKKRVTDLLQLVTALKKSADATQDDVKKLGDQLTNISSAERTLLQTSILDLCHVIQKDIEYGDIDYSEKLKQLIILYREYHACGFNSQGKLYFNDTIEKATEDNNILVHELMNQYFSDYQP